MASKQTPKTPAPVSGVPSIYVTTEVEGSTFGLTANPKVFSSGKPGFWGQSRWNIGGQEYMAQLQVVAIIKK